jgi:hypothetical protein
MALTQDQRKKLTEDQQDARLYNGIGTGIELAGNLESADSNFRFGEQTQKAAQFQAEQLRQNANTVVASAQRDAYFVQRQAEYARSTAIANAAASGGGASDPTVLNIIARNAEEMAYRKSLALYAGDDKARMLMMQADAKEFEGANAKANADRIGTASLFKAGTSLMRGMATDSSLYSRFGGDGPGGVDA